MPLASSELFRFTVGRAARVGLAPTGLAAPEYTMFEALALQRAHESPRPDLAEVANAFLAGTNAVSWSPDAPLIRAARSVCAQLSPYQLSDELDTLALARAALSQAGFEKARGAQERSAWVDQLWSSVTALHCAPVADVGALLSLSCAIRVFEIERAVLADEPPDLPRLLRGPLLLPLSGLLAAYAGQSTSRRKQEASLEEQVRQRQRAQAQKLVTVQGLFDKIKRIERDRAYAPVPVKNRSGPLNAAERNRLSSAERAVLAEIGVQSVPIGTVLAEVGASLRVHAGRVVQIGNPAAKPQMTALKSKTQQVSEARASLIQLDSESLRATLGPDLFQGRVSDLLGSVYPLPEDDVLTERLVPRIRPVGVLDLKLVETRLERYQLGEIAHVENVLATEYRQRVHKRQDTSEHTTMVEQQSTRENERNLESTERFEMQQEVSNTINERLQVTAGVQVSASGPCFSVGANAGFSYGRSSENAQKFSTEYAKEITEKTRERVETRVREVRQSMRRIVVEEGNTHTFDNTAAGSTHKVGVYRFVDKVLSARLLNYGRRMMFEFMVPEPAAALRSVERQTSAKPQPLPELSITPAELNAANYQYLAGLYGALEVESPPAMYMNLTSVLSRNTSSPAGDGSSAAPILLSGEIELPAGYAAYAFRLSLDSTGAAENVTYSWCVGHVESIRAHAVDTLSSGNAAAVPLYMFDYPIVAPKIGAWALIGNARQAVASVTLECMRQTARWEAWQNSTYAKIKDAYDIRLADIMDANRRLESQQRRGTTSQNPIVNRRREREELTRGCINVFNSMLLQGDYFDSVQVSASGVVVDVDDALREGQAVRFFHGAFEWDNMTYELFPYFWGKRERWAEMMLATHEDTKFEEFLRSGFARVMVPVKPGQEANVLNFLKLGLNGVFDGAREAIVNDPEFAHLMADLDEPLDPPKQEGEPWEMVVPTTLVKLQLEGEEGGLGVRGTQ